MWKCVEEWHAQNLSNSFFCASFVTDTCSSTAAKFCSVCLCFFNKKILRKVFNPKRGNESTWRYQSASFAAFPAEIKLTDLRMNTLSSFSPTHSFMQGATFALK